MVVMLVVWCFFCCMFCSRLVCRCLWGGIVGVGEDGDEYWLVCVVCCVCSRWLVCVRVCR